MARAQMRIAFDIGGVLSKYPDVLRPIISAMRKGGIEVFVITDMHNRAEVIETLALNGFDMIPEGYVFTADYNVHGEGCKAVLLEDLGIDIFLDDFIGYTTVGGAPIRCLVMPDASKPYYHPDWKVPGVQPDFGRRVYQKKEKGQ